MRKQSSFDLEAFFVANRGRAIALANAIGGGKIDPEEAASAAWLGFVRKARSEEIYKPSPYLRTCIANAVMDALREGGHSVNWDADDMERLVNKADDPSPPQVGPYWLGGLNQPQDSSLSAALGKLPFQQRAVIVLWAEAHPPRSDREIGQILNISQKTVNTHRSRALDRLRKEMADRDEVASSEQVLRPMRLSRRKGQPNAR